MTTQTKKILFTGIIAILILAAFYFWSDTMTLSEMIITIVGAAGYIGYVWEWFNRKEVEKDFLNEAGIKYKSFKALEKK